MTSSTTGRSERPLYTYAELTPLVRPRSVAVIGASERPGFGSKVVQHLKQTDVNLSVVNPRYAQVHGIDTVANVSDLPSDIDCAVLTVNGEMSLGLLEECAVRGIKSALFYASGFAETGTDEGAQGQRTIQDIANKYSMRICGPNALGMLNIRDGIFLSTHAREGAAGNIGVVSQSGGLGVYMTQQTPSEQNLFSYCFCAGNSADIDALDFANFVIEDDTSKAVILVIEGVPNVARLMELGEASRRASKAIIVLKAGRTTSGAAAAMSHTGTLAGSQAAVSAAFREAGLVEVHDYEDLLETAIFFSRAKPPKAHGVAVVTAMGGCGVLAADAAEEAGVPLPMPMGKTLDRLREMVPSFATFSNPADLTAAPGSGSKFDSALRLFAADPLFDVVVMPMAPGVKEEDRPRVASRVAEETGSNIAVYWMSSHLEGPGSEVLMLDKNVSIFRSVRRCFQAVAKWYWWHGLASPTTDLDSEWAALRNSGLVAEASGLISTALENAESRSRVTLNEDASRSVARAVGLPLVRGELATSPEEALRVASEVGYPVAAKAISQQVTHKTEAGAVRLGINDEDTLQEAFREVVSNTLAYAPTARVDGVLVTEMVGDALEVIVGARRDLTVGPLVVVGLGGSLVELFKAPAMSLAPVSHQRALEMIQEMPGSELLFGFRGSEPRDVSALADVVMRVSHLISDISELQEVDFNPVMVRVTGEGVAIADALIVVGK
ncbi:MAG: acetate--CoA ligase family protein [Acidimicrobiales bacterium]